MIGQIYLSMVEFYDVRLQKTSIKARPVLILSDLRNNDYTVLPISTISRNSNIDEEYDIKIIPEEYFNLKLNKISYIRTHKRIFLHRASVDLRSNLGDIKKDYPNLFLEILEKTEKFNKELIKSALK